MNPFTVITKLGKLNSMMPYSSLSCLDDDLATDTTVYIVIVFASLQFLIVVKCTADCVCLGSEM